jgi:hypothetical protein
VGKNNNIIEINGIKYDAKTGAAMPRANGHHATPAKQPLQTAVKRPTMSDVVRNPASHAAARAPKPSSTLMRHSVKKPSPTPRKHSKAQGHTTAVTTPTGSKPLVKQSINRVDDNLLLKAKRFPQSKLIQHFSQVTSDSNKFAAISPPAPLSTSPVSPNRPAQAQRKAPSKPQTTAELLDHALRHATSHEQKDHAKPKKKRGLKIASTAALLLVVLGVVISQQIPNVKLHMASAAAGFHASLPDYKPAGYRLSRMDSNSGVVATTFQSNSDQRQYTLTQKTSNWDSQALLDNFVAGHDKKYKVVEAAGRTVYIYGDHNATWVNAGIWYIVQSDGSLTNKQLSDLASSL